MYGFPKIPFMSGLMAWGVTWGLYATASHQIYWLNQSGPVQHVSVFQKVCWCKCAETVLQWKQYLCHCQTKAKPIISTLHYSMQRLQSFVYRNTRYTKYSTPKMCQGHKIMRGRKVSHTDQVQNWKSTTCTSFSGKHFSYVHGNSQHHLNYTVQSTAGL